MKYRWTEDEDAALRAVMERWADAQRLDSTVTVEWYAVAAELATVPGIRPRTASACNHRWLDFLSGREPPVPGTRFKARPEAEASAATPAPPGVEPPEDGPEDEPAELVHPEPKAPPAPEPPVDEPVVEALTLVHPDPLAPTPPAPRRPRADTLNRIVAYEALRDLASDKNTPPDVRLSAAVRLLES